MQLITGNLYFVVSFHDRDLTIPIIRTLVYESCVDRQGRTKVFLFRDIQRGGETETFGVDADNLEDLLVDELGLLETLKQCFDRTLATEPPASAKR